MNQQKLLGTTEVLSLQMQKTKMQFNLLTNFAGSELSSETIECLGGVKIQSKDGQ